MGIQLQPSDKYNQDWRNLVSDAKKLQRYVDIHGMFEKYENQQFGSYDKTVNKDIDSWKKYNNLLAIDQSGTLRLKFDLQDSVIMGSKNSFSKND